MYQTHKIRADVIKSNEKLHAKVRHIKHNVFPACFNTLILAVNDYCYDQDAPKNVPCCLMLFSEISK